MLVRTGGGGREDHLWFQVKTLNIVYIDWAHIDHYPPLCLFLSPAILLVELVYAVVGIAWLVQYYQPCSDVTAKNLALGEWKRI